MEVGAAGSNGFLYYRIAFVAYNIVRLNDLSVGGAGVCPEQPLLQGAEVCEKREGWIEQRLQVDAIRLEEKEIIKAFNILLHKFPL